MEQIRQSLQVIKHRELYMQTWRECLANDFTTNDAREYAQMVVDEKEKEIKQNEQKSILRSNGQQRN